MRKKESARSRSSAEGIKRARKYIKGNSGGKIEDIDEIKTKE